MSLVTRGLGSFRLVTRGLGGAQDQVVDLDQGRKRRRRGGGGRRNEQLKQFLQVFASITDDDKKETKAFKTKEFIPILAPKVYASLREEKQQGKLSLKEAMNPYKFNDNCVLIQDNEWKFLTFNVKIESSVKHDATYELIIHENDDRAHLFRGVPTKDGVIVRIPPLSDSLEQQQYMASFRVIVGEHILTPLMIKIDLVGEEETSSKIADNKLSELFQKTNNKFNLKNTNKILSEITQKTNNKPKLKNGDILLEAIQKTSLKLSLLNVL